jgi:hypothetical protein
VTGILNLDDALAFSGTVAGLAAGNAIDLLDRPFAQNTASAYRAEGAAGGTLSIGESGSTVKLALLGSYIAGAFEAASDGQGGTLIGEGPSPLMHHHQ